MESSASRIGRAFPALDISKMKVSVHVNIPGVFGAAPPVRNHTTITLHLARHTRNEAAAICTEKGGRLLDITYYSLFVNILTLAGVSPWSDLPVSNGPPAWIALHRKAWLTGETYYSGDCRTLQDYRIIYWNSADNFHLPDGPEGAYCAYHQVNATVSGQLKTSIHDFTRGNCSERHRFYCLHEDGPCVFEEFNDVKGVTSDDFSPKNDILLIGEKSNDACAERCLNASDIYPHPDLLLVEECWGYTMDAAGCTLHVVLRPDFFDVKSRRFSDVGSSLYVKRCFSSSVSNETFNTQRSDESEFPDTQCGVLDIENSTMTSPEVDVYLEAHTWNEAFRICRKSGKHLLNTKRALDYFATQQTWTKYLPKTSTYLIWLGLHEPCPQTDPDVWVWSDCSGVKEVTWDPRAPPSGSLLDTALCAVLNVTASTWLTASCDEFYPFVCMSLNETTVKSYDLGTSGKIGLDSTIGPMKVSNTTCRELCDTWRYEDQECWGYTWSLDTSDCHVHFTHDVTFQNVNLTSRTVSFLFRKHLLKDTVKAAGKVVPESSIFPTSCCDVTNIKSTCPSNTIPRYETNIPTTTKQRLVLYLQPTTWHSALRTCQERVGATLLRLDNVSKRHALIRFIDSWLELGLLGFTWKSEMWLGLSETRSNDPCSFRWSSDCTRPTWTDFADPNYASASPGDQYCVALDTNASFVKRTCTETKAFVCEYNEGPCGMTPATGVSCSEGTEEGKLEITNASCDESCKAATFRGMECWAHVQKDAETCVLYFYTDPGACSDTIAFPPNNTAVFKTCYTASHDVLSSPAVTVGAENCVHNFKYPIPSPPSNCPISSTRSATTATQRLFSPIYIWPCLCYETTSPNVTLTSTEWHEWITTSLTLPRNDTGRYRRTKLSLQDGRTSSKTMGFIAGSLLVAIGLYLLLTDAPKIVHDIRGNYDNARHRKIGKKISFDRKRE
ncbi:uncharacterized protein LOC127838044 isoform X1 [Dreissena polymorpha]|uniref:uncharacterized protein LOC127838044 isoform X1 n=1 Tax=Dreissena polymorpha TaxID=45954 RepID=UPI0022643739|nr:uncharacterized protein LOC127838044 isoform X1 [Dreissena polymorpha]